MLSVKPDKAPVALCGRCRLAARLSYPTAGMDPTDTWHPCTIRIARTAGWVLAALTVPLVSRRMGGFCGLLHGSDPPAKPPWSWHCAIRLAPVSVESRYSSNRDGRLVERINRGVQSARYAARVHRAAACAGFLPHMRSRTTHSDRPMRISLRKVPWEEVVRVGKKAHSPKAACTGIGPEVRKVSLIYRSDHG